ncbi:MAG: hypothetical protein HQL64_16020 [Magnetococcales bacterium]|nr:hypothetical protein [Magnetococcales bacterium]
MPNWKYDPGEWRKKHKWKQDNAGFEFNGQEEVGKCPNSITHDPALAEQLLNQGVCFPMDEAPPKEIYNVHQGVVYRAEPTLPGISFHGFPEKEQKARRVPTVVLWELARRAQTDGTFHLYRNWMREYLPEGWKIVARKFR